mmetsp:Transcript_25964/g.59358  ORF Transcript_25964/g.59358 Transcript_25964/m.59358 type:complete len:80 (-) Transcript_25964:17-256(-)
MPAIAETPAAAAALARKDLRSFSFSIADIAVDEAICCDPTWVLEEENPSTETTVAANSSSVATIVTIFGEYVETRGFPS